MLALDIRFESSWSNSFFENHGEKPRFTSGSALSKSARGLTGIPLNAPELREQRSRVPFIQAVQNANPGLLYRVPESYDGAVAGTLARLVGEIRRLSYLRVNEPDHLALRVFEHGQYHLEIDHEASQITSLATYVGNPVQSGGAGVLPDLALYGQTPQSRYLFGHLAYSLSELEQRFADGQTIDGPWTPNSPADVLGRLDVLLKEQKDTIKAAKKDAADGDRYVTPFERCFSQLAQWLREPARDQLDKNKKLLSTGEAVATTITAGALEDWPIAGALIVGRIAQLTEQGRQQFIDLGALTDRGNLAGLSMTGKVGATTPKDMFTFASGQRAVSYRLPYTIELPVLLPDGKTMFVPTGVLKKTGTLRFVLDGQADLEQEFYDAVLAASVGPFHFGKKGVAYVQSLRR